jgi:hypothetical protein
MDKLQRFAYASMPAPSSQENQGETRLPTPATPMPQRIPLSDLMSNTPKAADNAQEISPSEKIVWKLSPKKTPGQASASQGSPNATFLNLLNQENTKKRVRLF